MTTPTATAHGTMGNLTSPVRENNSCRRLRARFVTGPGRTKATSSFLTVRRRLWITRSDTGVRTSGSLWQPVIGYRLSAIENFRTYWPLTRRRVEFYRWRACKSRISLPTSRDLRGLITILCDVIDSKRDANRRSSLSIINAWALAALYKENFRRHSRFSN